VTANVNQRMRERLVQVPVPPGDGDPGPWRLLGILHLPPEPIGVVVFAGGARFSPRSQFIAAALHESGLATLLIDLIDARHGQADRDTIGLMTNRLLGVADWLRHDPDTRGLRIGYFAAGIGAAAALAAAARAPAAVTALVSWDGQLDLAAAQLVDVRTPTLIVVDDPELAGRLEEKALALLKCPKAVAVIPGATHLLPEPGPLREVALLAREWFQAQLLDPTERPT
jgi:putative phosphoribosyl transferase